MNVLNHHNDDYSRDSVTLGASLILFNPYIICIMNHYFWNIGQSLADRMVENPLDLVPIRPRSARELVKNMRGHIVDPVPDFVQRNQNHMRYFLNVNYRMSSSFFRR